MGLLQEMLAMTGQITPIKVLSLGGVALFVYVVFWCAYQLYFSPLAKFPGPKLAAVTRLYETYFDLIKWGQYTFEIGRMHKKYGPIVRISPYELHIDDPDYYEVLFSGHSSPRNKYVYFTRQFNSDEATFSTVDHFHHRLRRGALGPFFAKQRLLKLEDTIWELVEKLTSRFEEFRSSGRPLPLRPAFMCFTTDVITMYSMGRSWGRLDTEDFSPLWVKVIKDLAAFGHFFKHCPWMFSVLRTLPDKFVGFLSPIMGLIISFQREVEGQIQEIMNDKSAKGDRKYYVQGQPTIFHELIHSDLPAKEKTLTRLWQEGEIVVAAGSDTTANALTTAAYYLLENPDKLRKLKAELETVMPTPSTKPRLLDLEKLPYMTAVIQEGLRLSYGLSTRLQRIAPNETLKFKEWEIPPGTPVGMTSVFMHHNEEIFPDSHSFIPERWLERRADGRHLDRYMVAFSKGSRQCVGINLAKAEVYLALAAIFRRFDLSLFESTRDDIALKHDLFVPQPYQTSKGVRVLVD